MPQPTCKRCRQPLTPVFPGQDEHPLCSPTDTGWIPRPRDGRQDELAATALPHGLAIARSLAAHGRHILPLSSATKKPLGNCPACRDTHQIGNCPCIPAGRWCHGVRAATTDPDRLTAWWRAEPAAVPGIAAGPSGLVLIDIDAHRDELPADLATGLLPGINLAAEPVDRELWDDPGRYRDGRDSLRLLAAVRGGPRPWPADPAYQPVAVATPSGGRHLWYRAPAEGLRQALSDPDGRHGLAWQIDVKAGWSYGVAPGAATEAGTYCVLSGDPAKPADMPAWLAREVIRVATPNPASPPWTLTGPPAPGRRGAAYLSTVINRGTAELTKLADRPKPDGRKRALAKLAYHVGGLLAWSGLSREQITEQLANAGVASGLSPRDAHRIARRAIANGIARPVSPP